MLLYASIGYIWYLTLDTQMSDEDKAQYTLGKDEADIIAGPLSRLWAATPLNKQYGRTLLDNKDSIAAVVVLALYIERTRPLLAARAQRRASGNNKIIPMRRAQTNTAAPQAAVPPQGDNNGSSTNAGSQPPPTFDINPIDT